MMRVLLVVACAAACGDDVRATPDATPDAMSSLAPDQIAAIHAAVAGSLGKQLATGYSVAVWRDGAIVHREGFGTLDGSVPVTSDALFQIGSDTKKLTAIALLRQVQAGRARLAAGSRRTSTR